MDPLSMIDFLSGLTNSLSSILIVFAIMFGILQVRQYRSDTRRSATAAMLPVYLDRIERLRAKAYQAQFDEIHTGDGGNALELYLNELEGIAVLVLTGVWDDELARSWFGDELLTAFSANLDYVMMGRNNSKRSRLYSNLEYLSHRWGRR
jgi:hypothetical protein